MRKPCSELLAFLKPYDPAIVRFYLAARRAVLTTVPKANELVYDAYNAVSTAYSFSHALKDAFCHVVAYRGYVNLGFNQGATLQDPQRLLQGTGKNIRHIRIAHADDLQQHGVRSLLCAAVEQGRRAGMTLPDKPRAIIKATCAKKRRPPASNKSRGAARKSPQRHN